jgi:hypothetical protein
VTYDRLVVFSGHSVSSTNKTDHHDITEIFLKVALNTINQIKQIKTEQSRTLLLYCETSKVEIKYEYKLLKNCHFCTYNVWTLKDMRDLFAFAPVFDK